MSEVIKAMDDIPAGLWKWLAGGLLSTLIAGGTLFGSLFRWHSASLKEEIKEVRAEVREMDKKFGNHLDDMWSVINAEREALSRHMARTFDRLDQTPTREEMQKGFDRLERAIKGN